MGYKLFVDTNVYLDFLLQRGKDWQKAEAIFRLAENSLIQVFTSSSSMLNIMYIMGAYKISRREIVKNMTALLTFTKLADPDNTAFEVALFSDFKDLEDAVQYHTALEIDGINYFITSNIKDYKSQTHLLKVIKPIEFIDLYNSGKRL